MTVHDATYDLLRSLGMTTVFGNPGSTEEPFLPDFPADFNYVHALQEASAVAMADGYAQATGVPAHVNLHTAPGTGNGMGNLVTAWHNKTPLIVTAGQQTREMLLLNPGWPTADPTELPQPYVKWAYEPARAAGHPCGVACGRTRRRCSHRPGRSSSPCRWTTGTSRRPAPPVPRTVSHPVRARPRAAGRVRRPLGRQPQPGAGVRAGGGPRRRLGAAVALAEQARRAGLVRARHRRAVFPEDHPHFRGVLPSRSAALAEALRGHDLVLVDRRPGFRYYPYVPGGYLPDGTDLLHITDDPDGRGGPGR